MKYPAYINNDWVLIYSNNEVSNYIRIVDNILFVFNYEYPEILNDLWDIEMAVAVHEIHAFKNNYQYPLYRHLYMATEYLLPIFANEKLIDHKMLNNDKLNFDIEQRCNTILSYTDEQLFALVMEHEL